jgi:hypothetical protein
MYLKKNIFILLFFSSLLLGMTSTNIYAESEKKDDAKVDIGGMIMHHILDDYQYEVMEGVVIPLPIILYTEGHLFYR